MFVFIGDEYDAKYFSTASLTPNFHGNCLR